MWHLLGQRPCKGMLYKSRIGTKDGYGITDHSIPSFFSSSVLLHVTFFPFLEAVLSESTVLQEYPCGFVTLHFSVNLVLLLSL